MLKKLLKYEFKNGYLYVLAPCAGALLMAFVVRLLFSVKSPLTVVWGSAIVVTLLFGIAGVTLIALVKSIWSTMYGRRGPLTFSLPVSTTKLLLSKIIINVFWVAIAALSIIGILAIIDNSKTPMFGELNVENGWILAILVLLLFLGYLLYSIALALFLTALVNTNTFKKHRILFLILFWYLCGTVIDMLLKFIAIVPFSVVILYDPLSWSVQYTGFFPLFSAIYNEMTYGALFSLNDIFVLIAGAIGLFFATRAILNKKLSC